MEHLPCEEKQREPVLFSLEKRRLQGDQTADSQYLWGGDKEDRARVCTVVHGRKIRGNGCKLKEGSY